MELRDFLKIFLRQWRVMAFITITALALGFGWYVREPLSYQADLTLNVARTGTQTTTDYRYDGFYRLQADERFADTLVQWIGRPRVVTDTIAEAKTAPLSAWPVSFGPVFTARRLSSQTISVTYRAATPKAAKALAKELVAVLNRETTALNASADDTSWFTVQGSVPVVTDARHSLTLVLVVSGLSGMFIAFWAALFRHYWR